MAELPRKWKILQFSVSSHSSAWPNLLFFAPCIDIRISKFLIPMNYGKQQQIILLFQSGLHRQAGFRPIRHKFSSIFA